MDVGIDLGTTYTAAAVHRHGRAEIFPLGSRNAAMPSVVHLRADETVLTGEAAVRRAATEPARAAREFKRRFGDTTPILLGGVPYSAEALTARLLRSVLAEISAREGSPPDRVGISHPANWGPYKTELLRGAIRIADLDPDRVRFVTEPECAAMYYAQQERVEPGEVVAVYDLGGGTFDAAVLQRTDDGFVILGRPEGIERLGGIDFDGAVFAHVTQALGQAFHALDTDDPATVAGLTRLRQDCVEAKEALSTDTDTAIAVLLPTLSTEVRLTRAEFEAMIRPALADTIGALGRALRSAGVVADDVTKVLLVGGSSRIPLVAEMVSREMGRPVVVDVHPKHVVAMGAALAATLLPTGAPAVGSAPVVAAAPLPTLPPEPPPAVPAPPPAPAAPITPAPAAPSTPAPAAPSTPAPPPATVPLPAPPPQRPTPRWARTASVAAIVIAIAAVAVGVVTLAPGGDPGEAAPPAATTSTSAAATTTVATIATTTVPDTDAAAQRVAGAIERLGLDRPTVDVAVSAVGDAVVLDGVVEDESVRTWVLEAARDGAGATYVDDRLAVRPSDERCTEEIRSRERWVCLTWVEWDGTWLRATYRTGLVGDERLDVNTHYHLHVFGSDVAPEDSGTQSSMPGKWLVWDQDTLDVKGSQVFAGEVPEKLCVRMGDAQHRSDPASGNCWPVSRYG